MGLVFVSLYNDNDIVSCTQMNYDLNVLLALLNNKLQFSDLLFILLFVDGLIAQRSSKRIITKQQLGLNERSVFEHRLIIKISQQVRKEEL